jgi:hypothetical protein
MRFGKTLGLAALGALLLAACNDGGNGTSINSSTTEGTLAYSPPLRIASLSAAALTAQLNASATGQQLLAIAGTPKCGVDFHLIQYTTVGGAGEATSATGALMAPTGAGCTGALPIVEYAHGTATTSGYNIADPTATTNEANGESVLIATMFAAQGYIVVAPNYVGYDQADVATLSYHPYLNRAQNARDMIDALTAARSALAAGLPSGVTDGGKLFLTGYSEGGFVAMATHQAMQAAGMTVTAAAPMSGPYATEALGDAIVFGEVDLGATVFLPLITESYQHAYGNIYTEPSQFYESTYATGIDTLLPNSQPIADVFTMGLLPETALFSSTPTGLGPLDAFTAAAQANPLFALGFGSSNLIKNSVRIAYATDAFTQPDGAFPTPMAGVPLAAAPTYPLRIALKKNDLRSWTNPAAPMLLCGGHDDPTVFYSINTQTMASFWPGQVSGGLVSVLDVDPGAVFTAGGIAYQVGTIAATVFGTDLGGGVSSAAKYSADVQAAVVGNFAAYFTITASGATPNSPQGILVAGVSGIAAQVVAADFAAGVTVPAKVLVDVGDAIAESYHGTLVPPACTVAARAFFAHF